MTAQKSRNAALKADPRLAAYFSSEEERRRITREMFDKAAAGYDEAERWTGLGTGPWYRRRVLRESGLRAGMHVLDVAAGTGLVTVAAHELVGPQGHVVALDPSPGMLAELKNKLSVEVLEGFAENIPMTDASVDFVSMGYALRHVGDLDLAFPEYFRVLRPGGQVCLMEISRPASRIGQALLSGYIRGIVPLLSRLSGSRAEIGRLWEYYADTIDTAIDPKHILAALRAAGFTDVRSSLTLGVFREYFARKP